MADAPLNRHQRKQLLERIRKHEADFATFANHRKTTIAILFELADELNLISKNKERISKIAGSVSAGLMVTGMVLALSGAIGDIVVSESRREQCNQVLEADNQAVLEFQNAMEGFNFFIRFVRGVAPIGRGVGAAIDAVPIVGAVFNLITLPIDIGTLINAIDIHKSTPHQIGAIITQVAQQLQDQLKELQLRHDEEMEELAHALLSQNRMSPRDIAFYVCVIVVLAILNLVFFWS